jgi:N-acyl homoserine lactone hydrolase
MNAGPIGAQSDGAGLGRRSYIGAMLMFLVTGGDRPVLVDTGPLDEDWTRRHHGCVVDRPADLEPANVLARHGIEPGDIEIVINTHLHWDHCSNNALFPSATFYVQRDELIYASDPLPVHRRAYEKAPGLAPAWLDVWGRLELADGDAEIAPGVSVVQLAGHSPGSQGVLVKGAVPYLIAGDAVNTYADWEGNDAVRHVPPGVNTSLVDCFASFEKIERLGCEVIPSHDLSLLDHGPFTVPQGLN